MPKAKTYKGKRLTLSAGKRKRENGRPKGTFKKYRFEETRLGFMLKYEVPAVFEIIMNMTPNAPFKEPPYMLVCTICKNSKDEALKKKKFFRYLEEYKQQGLCCKRPKKMTPQRKVYYELLRKRKLEKYIEKNREQIERKRKEQRMVNFNN